MRISYFVRKHLIPLILASLTAIIAFLLLSDVSRSSEKTLEVDRIEAYVLSTGGQTILKRGSETFSLKKDGRMTIAQSDKVRTLADSSATLFWPDGSVTRLGEKTNITIYELQWGVTTQVDFSITEGKSWSNVVRYLDPNSHFKQRFDNDIKVAAVRGTVFEIQADKDYIRTISHSIDIQDEKGVLIRPLSAGSIASEERVLESLPQTVIDQDWSSTNTALDQILSAELRAKWKAKIDSVALTQDWKLICTNFIRSLIGKDPLGLPFEVIYAPDGSVQKVVVDDARMKLVSESDRKSLVALYEWLGNAPSTGDIVDPRIALRDQIIRILPEKDRARYLDAFARASLYESWDALESDIPQKTQRLREEIQKYGELGADMESIQRLQDSLSESKISEFNSRIESWKQKGFDMLSSKDWLEQTFRLDTQSIKNSIDDFNSSIDGLFKK